MDRNVTAHPISTQNIKRLPSEYLGCLYYDSCVYGPAVLEALIKRVGVDRVIFGTDYPFGEADPVAGVAKCPGLAPSQLEQIVSKTPAEILGIARKNLARSV